MESLAAFLTNLDPWAVYAVVGGIAFIENIFPPFPSDVLVVAAGSLVGLGRVDAVILVLATTVGSTTGFMTMYGIGLPIRRGLALKAAMLRSIASASTS